MAKGHRSQIKRERNENKDTRPSAKLSYARVSVTKACFVLDAIRGKDVKEALEKEDASLDDIKDKTSKLQEKAMELAGKVYESAAKANESTDDNSSDSDVEEAEFVDKK